MYNFTVNLDDASCYRALASRDRRFEGRFVVGVKTTGVYCRPGCPARLPKRQNTSFYRCAAAAEEAGFRACRRCRPETAPGTPAWAGTSSTVSRALRLIGDGGLDGYGVDDLAERLGVGSRHLRRLFVRHLGAGPLAVARTRRAHFARRLIDETELPLSQIALGSGFQSIRAFNTTMRETFDASPRELRRSTHPASRGGTMVLRIPFRPPIDWPGLLEFLGKRAIEGVERVDRGRYERSFRAASGVGVLSGTPGRSSSASLTRPAPISSASSRTSHGCSISTQTHSRSGVTCGEIPCCALRSDPPAASGCQVHTIASRWSRKPCSASRSPWRARARSLAASRPATA